MKLWDGGYGRISFRWPRGAKACPPGGRVAVKRRGHAGMIWAELHSTVFPVSGSLSSAVRFRGDLYLTNTKGPVALGRSLPTLLCINIT